MPAASLSRDRVLFEAGRRSARTYTLWPFSTAALAVLSAVLAIRPVGEFASSGSRTTMPAPAVSVSPAVRAAAAPERPTQPTPTFLKLLLQGAPDRLPGDSEVATRFEVGFNYGAIGAADEDDLSMPPLEEWLGLTPGTLIQQRKPHADFGPIPRGDAR
jgi:hypothetical protein